MLFNVVVFDVSEKDLDVTVLGEVFDVLQAVEFNLSVAFVVNLNVDGLPDVVLLKDCETASVVKLLVCLGVVTLTVVVSLVLVALSEELVTFFDATVDCETVVVGAAAVVVFDDVDVLVVDISDVSVENLLSVFSVAICFSRSSMLFHPVNSCSTPKSVFTLRYSLDSDICMYSPRFN